MAYIDYYKILGVDKKASQDDIKKAFKLENLKVVTLSDIFNSDVDVVSEKVQKIFM